MHLCAPHLRSFPQPQQCVCVASHAMAQPGAFLQQPTLPHNLASSLSSLQVACISKYLQEHRHWLSQQLSTSTCFLLFLGKYPLSSISCASTHSNPSAHGGKHSAKRSLAQVLKQQGLQHVSEEHTAPPAKQLAYTSRSHISHNARCVGCKDNSCSACCQLHVQALLLDTHHLLSAVC
jgi:hypothetical protein